MVPLDAKGAHSFLDTVLQVGVVYCFHQSFVFLYKNTFSFVRSDFVFRGFLTVCTTFNDQQLSQMRLYEKINGHFVICQRLSKLLATPSVVYSSMLLNNVVKLSQTESVHTIVCQYNSKSVHMIESPSIKF